MKNLQISLSTKSAAAFLLMLSVLLQFRPALSATYPETDPELFNAMFSNQKISEDWIEPAARLELTPAMLQQITTDLQQQGGTYSTATKTARGWLLQFEKGEVRARIVRSKFGKLIGVFFSDVEYTN